MTDDELLAAAHEQGYPYPYDEPELNGLMEGMMRAKALHEHTPIGDAFEQYPGAEAFVSIAIQAGVDHRTLVGAIETGLGLVHAQGNGFDALGPRIQAMLDEDPLLTVAKTMIHSADVFDLSKAPATGMSVEGEIALARQALLAMAMAIMVRAAGLRRR